MDSTLPQVIGHNVRQRRDALGITAAALGEKVGQVLGKPWPRQTVYLMEGGERAMIAAEVAALAHVLGTTPAQLFTPPIDVAIVQVGNLAIDSESLTATGLESMDATALATIERDLKWIWQNTDDTRTVISRVQEQIKDYREIGKLPRGVVAQMVAESAQREELVRRSDAEWAELEAEERGEGN